MENPYEPPKSTWENPLPKDAPRLFNPTASSMFAILFGLPLACFLHAANWKALGEHKYSSANIWIGVVWIVLAVGVLLRPPLSMAAICKAIMPFNGRF
ncbi:MAG: hypothetical protein IKI11_08810 [Neisseriaceae bacterium]|nr:hypothetical protein [Neisseriaceae bacterium]